MEFDKIILGEDVDYTTDSNITQLNNNVAVIGGSGSGKSMSYSEPRILELHNSNMIMKVSKRKMIDKYTPLLKSRGYKVEVLDLVNPKKSTVAFDPLYLVDSSDDVNYLAEALVNLDPKKAGCNTKSDPYWDESAISLLTALIYLTFALGDDKTSLSKTIEYLKQMKISDNGSGISTSIDYYFDSIRDGSPDHPCLFPWKSFSDNATRTARCIYSTLVTSIDKVFTSEILEMMNNENKLDFNSFAKEKTVLFILTSAVSPSLHSFANLFFSYAIKELFEIAEKQSNGMLPIPMHLLCDDFAAGGKILNFEEYISIFREKGISVSMLLQSESQLTAMYGEMSATTILNNCDTYIYLGGMDLITCEHISKRVNLPLDEILYMPIGQEIIFRRGQKPIITQRYDILNNKLYQQIIDKTEKISHSNKLKNADERRKENKFEKVELSLNKENEESEEDLQAELEAKFDELFGDVS